jgi:cobaltochelatase CobS
MPITYPATFSGICGRCSKPFVAGERITHGTGKGKSRVKYHALCDSTSMEQEKMAVPEPQNIDIWQHVANGVLPHLRPHFNVQIDEAKLVRNVEDIIKAEVARLCVPQTITIKVQDTTYHLEGITPHKQFPKLLTLLLQRQNVYLYGDPGWGKSEGAYQAAKAIRTKKFPNGLPFSGITLVLQTSDTRLLGYKDARGEYNPTHLREFYANGGLYLIDEADRASGNTLTAMNGTLTNGRGFFPDGTIERHEDFVCVATGNTTGRGSNPNFPEARPLDEAFRDRFFFLEWEPDPAFERSIALGINPAAEPWIAWVQAVRTYVKENQIRLTVSPRASYTIAKLLSSIKGTLTADDLINGVLFRGLDRDTVHRIKTAHPYPVL